jgi:hypothetical protein
LIQTERSPLGGELLLRSGGPHQQESGIARSHPDQKEHERDYADHYGEAGEAALKEAAQHG